MKEIEKIIQLYDKSLLKEERMALGTVVKVEGSSYRRIGARMLLTESGLWTGGISGGCIEGDALKRAMVAIQKKTSSIVVYDTSEDDPHQIGVGLGCNGRIEVLFTPVTTTSKKNLIDFFKGIINSRQATVLLQILRIKEGDQNLQGQFFSTEQLKRCSKATQITLEVLQDCLVEVQSHKKSKVFLLKNKDNCIFEVLFEFIKPRIKLICAGDNYDVQAMINLANEMGWSVHLVGKKRKIRKALFQKVQSFSEISQYNPHDIDEYTAMVLMTHDFKTDLKLLKKLAEFELPYLGILGPKKRMQKLDSELRKEGKTLDSFQHLYAPVGLDVGAETPEEIALAIAAEILSAFRSRDAGFLKNRKGSIHL